MYTILKDFILKTKKVYIKYKSDYIPLLNCYFVEKKLLFYRTSSNFFLLHQQSFFVQLHQRFSHFSHPFFLICPHSIIVIFDHIYWNHTIRYPTHLEHIKKNWRDGNKNKGKST